MKLLKPRRLFQSKRTSTPAPALTEEQRELCAKYFDLEHYRKVSGTASFTSKNGLDHYLASGWREGLDPSMNFSTRGYLDLYPDVTEGDINPLIHFVLHGQFEGRHIQRVDGAFGGKIESLTLNGIRGWAVSERNREMIIPLKVMMNGQHYATIENSQSRPDLRQHGISGGAGGFQLAIPFSHLDPDTYEVSIEFPDGSSLIESQTVESSIRVFREDISPNLSPERAADLKVVVPIYNALDDVRVCIERLREYTPWGVEVILINDGSSDPAIADELGKVDNEGMFRVLHNPINMGFTRTVNRGISEAGDADVIILNSDARVTPRWIEGMYAAAQSRRKVATVTAMSDRAGAFSAPNIGNDNPLPAGVSEEDFAVAFRRRSLRLYPEVPTGNGFCMLIRRKALEELGALDSDAFPRGYGEENDFCMRALRAGWVNLIDDTTYVFHDRSKSFGDEKNENIAKGRAVVDERYPEYKMLTGVYQTGSSIVMARFRARLAMSDCTNGRGILPRAIFVLATRTGGTPQTNADLMGALSDTFECYVLISDSRKLELSVYEGGETRVLKTHELQEPIEPLTHTSWEYDQVVGAWLSALDLSIVHIRHLGWHSLSLPKIARKTGARVVMSFHDYYALSPSLKLLDDENKFCGKTYTEAGDKRPIEIWPGNSLPRLTDTWLGYWRQRMGNALEHCDSFVTTSQSARDRVAEAFAKVPPNHFHVIPHGRDFAELMDLRQPFDGASPIRVLVPGNINEAKGLHLIAALIDLDPSRMFEFHILGGVRMDDLSEHQRDRLHFHGRYEREDFGEKVAAIAPHFGVIFSVWDETYCHTLTEMWSVGLPVAVLDFPNVRNRVERSQAGWILEDLRPEAVFASLVSIKSDREELNKKGLAVHRWQQERGQAQSCQQMASRYLDVYRGRDVNEPCPKIAILPRVQPESLHGDRIKADRVLERSRNRLDRPNTYILSSVAASIAQMRLGMIDGAIIQSSAIPAEFVDSFVEAAKETNTPFVLDLDEKLTEDSSSGSDGDPVGEPMSLAKLISNCALLTAPTQGLDGIIRASKKSVIPFDHAIESRLWAGGRDVPSRPKPHVLYLATGADEAECELALKILMASREKIPDLRATVISSRDEAHWPDWIENPPIPVPDWTYEAFVPWLKRAASEATLAILPCFDISPGEIRLGRIVLECGALGLPVFASDTTKLREVTKAISEGVRLVKEATPEAWEQVLSEALSQSKRLEADGKALQSWVFANHSIEAAEVRFDEAIRTALHPDLDQPDPQRPAPE
ncbi:MAG: glycosyltransferase [Pseudomonadota bacterium]